MSAALQISVVGESDDSWLRKIATLAVSIRLAAGDWPTREVTAHIVNGVEDASVLTAAGVRAVPVAAVEERSPLNKIRMFERADPSGTLLALDCDLLVARQVVAPRPDCVAVVPAAYSLLPRPKWKRLFAALRLPLLERPMISTVSREPMPVAYVNSGVVMMPGRWASELAGAWRHYADLLRNVAGFADGVLGFHREQVALTCALTRLRLPVLALPVEYNAPFWAPRLPAVRVLHYHEQIDPDGRVRRPPSPQAQQVVARVNAELARRCPKGKKPGPSPRD